MENVRTLAILLALPAVCTGRFLLSFVAQKEREKTWRRVFSDSKLRWAMYMHSLPRLAYLSGSTQDIYTHWAKRNNMKTYIDDIGENAKLLWILDEKWEGNIPSRVVLYLHGGGFHLPMFADSASFWYHVQKELKNPYELDVGVAILDFTLMPEAKFPVPLRQTIAAIQYLFSRRFKPSDIILMGDSAGANLALQVILHVLHPLNDLPALFESPSREDQESKFAGVYLMSPWLNLLPREDSSSRSYEENAMWDIVPLEKVTFSGQALLRGVEKKHLPYIDSHFAPPNWYDDIGAVVKKVLITAGRNECMRDDIIKFGKHLESMGGLEVKLVVDEHGIHDDPLLDFVSGEKKLGELTPMIVRWCRDSLVPARL